jgi:hypothetical protein
MRQFSVNRTQYPIGQGGFHYTEIYDYWRELSFSVVYDCGGSDEEHRQKVINAFAAGVPKNHDLLVISHLDLDHINGLPQLKKAGQSFSHVILPHLKDKQKFFMWMAFVALANGKKPEGVKEGIETAINLYGGAYGKPVMITHDPDPNPQAAQEPRDKDKADNPAFLLLDLLEYPNLGDALSDRSSFAIGQFDWQLRFYSREWDCQLADDIWNLPVLIPLKKKISELVNSCVTDSPKSVDDLVELLEEKVDKNKCTSALQTINEKSSANKDMTIKSLIGRLYALTELKNYNSASLCMYSGPSERGNGIARFSFNRHVHGLPVHETQRLAPVQNTRSVGWLGTGDSHFPDQAAVDEFAKHFLTELPRVSTIMVPHHGSRHNYAKGSDFSPLLSLIGRFSLGVRLFLVAAKRSVYGHPHEEVAAVLRRADVLQIVDESALTQIDESIVTVWQ